MVQGGIARDQDRRGNLLSTVQSSETLLYSWDDESQLTSVRLDPPSSPVIQPWRIDFEYDGLRRLRRVLQYTWNGSAWTSQGETRYLYDGMLIVQERNSSNVPQVQYTRGLDLSGSIEGAGGIGGLLMRSHGYSGGNWSSHNAYHSDANGNVTALMSSAGVLQASYKYNPYGGLIGSSGSLASANTMRFSSKPAIFSSTGWWGFYYYGYRFYDPGMQRWLNRDPIGEEGGVNIYSFVRNGPVNAFDADGLVEFPQLPTIPSFPWPNTLPRPTRPPRIRQSWPRINLPEDPISCGNRIKNQVWEKFAPGGVAPANDPQFYYGHCVAHCRIQRECVGGRCTSWLGGFGKEVLDEFKQWGGKGVGWDGGDMDANDEGRKLGRNSKNKTCEAACRERYP